MCPYWNWIILKDVWHSTKRLFLVHSSSYEVTCVFVFGMPQNVCFDFLWTFSRRNSLQNQCAWNILDFSVSLVVLVFNVKEMLPILQYLLIVNNDFFSFSILELSFFFFCNPLTVNYREILVKGLVSICFSLHSPVTMHSDFSLWWTNNSLH